MELFPKLVNSTLCLTCLSVDRKMIKLGKLYDVYHKVVAFDSLFSSNLMDIESLCWECHATLQRIHKFQKQVWSAQQLLNSNQNPIRTLSSLTTCVKPISIQNTLIKDEVVLKHEKLDVDVSEVECEFVYENDYHFDQYDEIKTEVEDRINKHEVNIEDTEVKKEKCPKDNIFSKMTQIAMVNNITLRKVTEEEPKGTESEFFEEWKPKNRKCKSTNKLKEKSSKLNQINVQTNSKDKSNIIVDFDCLDENNDRFDAGLFETETIRKVSTNDIDRAKKKAMNNKNHRKMREKMNELPAYRYLTDIEDLFIDDSNRENEVTDENVMAEKDAKGSYLATTDSLVFRCRICGSLVSRAERNNHFKRHKKAVQCIKCELVLIDRREYFKHYKEWHRKFTCDICGVTTKARFVLVKHMKRKHTPMTCEVCNSKLKNLPLYRLHMIHKHTPTIAAYCVECDECFDSDFHYRRHLGDSIRHKNKPKLKYPCPDCDKVFSKNIYMLNHRDFVHLKNYKNRCELCDKNYPRKSALMNHNRLVHEGVERRKDKVCYICGRAFSCNKILTNHVYTHTGERPHACDVCPARFSQLFALTTHRRARHPEAPPRLVHRRAHSTRPYGCDRCPSKYASEKNLEEHMKTIHLVSKVK